ncbi:MAG: peptide chain release factor 2 [Deltaproteobacteria bacterium]
MLNENRDKIQDLKKRLAVLRDFLNLPARESRIRELDKIIADDAFWSDAESAQKTLKEQSQIKHSIAEIDALAGNLEDAEILCELSFEEQDEATAEESRHKLAQIEKKVDELEFKRVLGGVDDGRNAIVSINAGAGGTEAQDWADILLRMYLRYAERNRYEVEMLDHQPGDEAGLKGATFFVKGAYAFGYLKAESGVHRLVRISPFDANKRRHTSFASVFVSPEIDDDIQIEIDEKDLRVDTFRAGGKGGQHVNKTDSAIRITHLPSGIVVGCQNERSQHQNRAVAMKVLRAKLYELEKVKLKEKFEQFEASKKEIGWGSQIRSYVLHPYRMIKDHRTDFETGNVEPILDGDLEEFIKSYLMLASGMNKGAAA